MPDFPMLADDVRRRMLAPRTAERVRVVIDSDMANEIDDQFTLAWALLRQDVLAIEGVYAVPFSFQYRLDALRFAYDTIQSGTVDTLSGTEAHLVAAYVEVAQRHVQLSTSPHDLTQPTPAEGMERSYEEVQRVLDKMNMTANVYRGSDGYLPDDKTPIRSEAAEHLVTTAQTASPDEPLYVVAIGAATNVASALLLAPEIIRNIVVIWTAGYPTTSPQVNASFNLEQDVPASQLLFDSGVPLVYLPGFHIGAQLRLSLPEVERWVQGRGAIGDYLHHLYTQNPLFPLLGIDDHFGRTWVIWDLINIAWLLEPNWVPTSLVAAPLLGNDKRWYHNGQRHLMREAFGIDRDAIFRDFFRRLDAFAQEVGS